MCGIAGVVDPRVPAGSREETVRRMCNAMIHRGPDDAGLASFGATSIGMRRLAIFDPLNGHQPMVTADGSHALVFNGAIYNYKALQRELEASGWSFRTRCDTEVLLAALVHWGEAALPRLRGMFAFAFWDGVHQTLLLARDPFGIKPLYFSMESGRLAFASEVAALIGSGAAAADIDPVSVADYLGWLAVPAPRTIYKGISSLEPGQILRHGPEGTQLSTYWTLASLATASAPCATRQDFTRELRLQLDDTIRHHLLADVPVGAFLSGGLDSAVIVGLMSRLSSSALQTFSIGFEEDGYSEADEAESTAHHFGAVHHTRILTGDEVARDLGTILSSCDQPTGDGVNTFYVSQTANLGGVKVALSGLGGDELFGGYPSFQRLPSLARQVALFGRLPRSVRSFAARVLSGGGTGARKLADILRLAREPHEVAALQRRVFSQERMGSVLHPDAACRVAQAGAFHPQLDNLRTQVTSRDLFQISSAWELRTYMADVLLRDSDVMSMRHSLELRVPFVDVPLATWLWRQKSEFKFTPRAPKRALVDATADILPPGLSARKKRGFTLPFPIWMRRDLRPFLEETFSTQSLGKSGFFAPGPIRSQWSQFLDYGDNREWSRIWSLAVLVDFVNRKVPAPAA